MFSTYSDDQYEAAEVEIDDPVWFYNSGYLLNGKEIDRYDADMLAFYFIYQGKRVPSIEEARRYFDVKPTSFAVTVIHKDSIYFFRFLSVKRG